MESRKCHKTHVTLNPKGTTSGGKAQRGAEGCEIRDREEGWQNYTMFENITMKQ